MTHDQKPSKQVLVSISLGGENIPVGHCWFHARKGRESASFEYAESWLSHPQRLALEPALTLTAGSFHTQPGRAIFGSLGDSAPDRWGRILMRRSATLRSKTEHKIPRTLLEVDYLLGVNDEARQGALRFSMPTEPKQFLTPKHQKSIPPLISLPKLLSASDRFLDEHESQEDLKLLLAPGSSLGGARPKASIRDQDGCLAIAKFPRKDDEFNVVLWEAVALSLAAKAGIKVPDWRIEKVLQQPVLILKRFDRRGQAGEPSQQRVPFLSAMTMLNAQDNEQHSYLEIAYAITQYGATPEQDLAELWRRIVFSVLISNTDDHLRNHGFIYAQHQGWRLSPVYDINPTPLEIKPNILTTAIDFEDRSASLATALHVADEFRLSTRQAQQIIVEVKSAVQQWREVATYFGLTKSACNQMRSAFQLAY